MNKNIHTSTTYYKHQFRNFFCTQLLFFLSKSSIGNIIVINICTKMGRWKYCKKHCKNGQRHCFTPIFNRSDKNDEKSFNADATNQ